MTLITAWTRVTFLTALLLAVPALGKEDMQAAGVSEQLAQFDQDLADLRALGQRIESAPEQDREALVYRRDDRSFQLLVQLGELARDAAGLGADDPVRTAVQERFENELQDTGKIVLQRIRELGRRMDSLRAEREGAGGAQLASTEAYIQSLENLRFRYYDALVDVAESRRALGMPDEAMEQGLLSVLYLHSETLVGRIELTGGALDELRARQAEDVGNADVAAAAADMARQQKLDLGHLATLINLLKRLGEDPASYQTVLLQQGQGLSIRSLETGVIVSLLRDTWRFLSQAAVERGPDLLFQIVVFAVIVLVFRYLSRLTRKLVKTACERPGVDISTLLKDVLVSVCGGTVMVIGVLIALAQVGISLGPMLAGLGVAGFVVGFALQDTLGNFAAGGMILIYRPYDVDDFIEVAGAQGLVKKMSLVSTTITTFDNQTLVVPNSKIWGDVIKNVTAQKVRRVDLVFGIGYGDDIALAERVLGEILEENDMVLSQPAANIKLHELGDSSVNFVVRPWVKTEDYWNAYWAITREVKLRFDREGISIPFPQRDVHLYREQT